jgi:hypothetical protein
VKLPPGVAALINASVDKRSRANLNSDEHSGPELGDLEYSRNILADVSVWY